MDAHVAQAAGAEIPPAAPFERDIGGVIRPPRRRAEPEVPVQVSRHGRRVLGPFDALGPIKRQLAPMRGAVRPDMDLAHRPDGAVGEPFVDQPVAFERHALVAHLGGHLRLPGRLGHRPRLVNRARQRFLAVHVLAVLEGRHRHHGVEVIGRGDHHCIDALFLLEHHPEIAVVPGLGIFFERVGGIVPVHVAQRDDVLAAHVAQVVRALSADANAGQVQLLVRRNPAGPPNTCRGKTVKAVTATEGARNWRRENAATGEGRGCFMRAEGNYGSLMLV